MRESGFVATSDIAREPTCSWCNRPLTLPLLQEYGAGQRGLNPTQSDTHIIVHKHWPSLPLTHTYTQANTHSLSRSLIHRLTVHTWYTKKTHTPLWKLQDWRPAPFLIWECIIWLGRRNVACCFISVQAWSLYFCLWMLSSCSSSPAPLPRLLQCL